MTSKPVSVREASRRQNVRVARGRRSVVVVAEPGDSIALATTKSLRAARVPVVRRRPQALAGLRVSLRNDTFIVSGRPVGGILFRVSPDANFPDGFSPEDRRFCDAEVRATWLAAIHLPGIFAVNRLDARQWFEGTSWATWREPLVQAGIGVTPIRVGAVDGATARGPGDAGGGPVRWLPYTAAHLRPPPGPIARRTLGVALARATAWRTSLVATGRVVGGDASPSVMRTARVLASAGIQLAAVATDDRRQVLWVDTLPAVSAPQEAAEAAGLLTGAFCAHLSRG